MARIVRFADTLSSHMALQQAPSRAAVYGTIDADMSWMHSLPEVDVKVVGDEPQGPCQHYCPDSQSLPHMRGSCSRPGCKGCSVCAATKSHAVLYSTKANVTRSARGQLQWLAYLRPTAGGPDEYAIHATLLPDLRALQAREANHSTGATLRHVVFGDVWLCSGQSNMQLPLRGTLERADALAKVAANPAVGNIRLLDDTQPRPPEVTWRTAQGAAAEALPQSGDPVLYDMCAVCWYFAEALVEEFERAGRPPPTLGIACAAAAGTPIEQWLPPPTSCAVTPGVNGADFEKRLRPFTRMTLKGWLWYQVPARP